MKIAFDHISFDSKHDVQCLKCLTFNVGLISNSYYCLGCGEKIPPLTNPDGELAEVISLQDFKNQQKEKENVR